MKFFVVAVLACLPASAAAVQDVAIQDVTVIDVLTGAARPHRNVLIRGDRIASIGEALPAAARVVNGRGKFLIPGLWDMRVHLWYKENQLPIFLAFGVTGVQDAGSDFDRVSHWRAEIESGKAIGPRIVTAGPAVGAEPSSDPKSAVLAAPTPRDARKAFDRLWDLNVDSIQILPDVSRDSYFALAEQARHWHLPLEGPIPDAVTAGEAIEARQRVLEYLSGVLKAVSSDAEAIDFFEQCATRGVRIMPMLTGWQRIAHANDAALASDAALQYVAAGIRNSWPAMTDENSPAKNQMEKIYRLVGLAMRTKVEVLAGTDTGEPWTIPGVTLHLELEQLVAAGMTTDQALRTATVAPARFFDREEQGTVEKGKIADLVLLDGNPLADIRNTRRVAAVFARGRYFSRKDLDLILAGK